MQRTPEENLLYWMDRAHEEQDMADGNISRGERVVARRRIRKATRFEFEADGIVPPMLANTTSDWDFLERNY